MTKHTELNILHFNNVYHVSPTKDEPVGGASRFATAIQDVSKELDHPLLLFSGDAFNPCLESSITRGIHITKVLNQLNIDVACVGNHDFDFGVPQLRKLINNTNFPWLFSNVLYADGSSPDPIKQWHVINDHHSGLNIGVIGLVEKDWIQTIPSFPPDLIYHDFIEVANQLSNMLRDPNGPYKVDLVIALTHMRVPNDIKLAQSCQDTIDLVLGGHDHFVYMSKSIDIIGEHWSREENLKDVGFDPEGTIQDTSRIRVVKSGTDFREFGVLRLNIDTDDNGKKFIQSMTAERKVVTSDIKVDEEMEKVVSEVASLVSSKMDRAVGYTTVPLEGRSMKVRLQETNLGNLMADLMLAYYSSLDPPVEIALGCGGTVRNDSVFDVGPITLGNIMTAFPFQDPVVVLRLTGQQIWDAVENGLSKFPAQEGRFPQVAGIKVNWYANRPPGERLESIWCVKRNPQRPVKQREHSILPDQNELYQRYQVENMVPLDLNKEYVVAARNYMTKGYDGYKALVSPPEKYIVDAENGVFISTIFRKFFLGLKYINAFREHFVKHHQDSETRNKNDICNAHDNEHTRKEHVDKLVASIARHWKKEARKIQAHNHPLDGRPCDCPSSEACQTYLSHEIEMRAKWHCLNDTIMDALDGSQLGHPSCIQSEEDEDNDTSYDWQEEQEKEKNIQQKQHESWTKRWASIGPVVQKRLVQLDLDQ
ncbi:unnamed protein product [Cunninghamella blakesleeana]